MNKSIGSNPTTKTDYSHPHQSFERHQPLALCHLIHLNDSLINLYFSFHLLGLTTAAIRNVSLLVDPPSVRRGQHATFICSYDLGGAPLYSVKFYRGNHEFYRYSPSELPMSKVFQFVGFNVDVSIPADILLSSLILFAYLSKIS